ncbi:hypothetical protein D3C72_488460 [compost metagenome]
MRLNDVSHATDAGTAVVSKGDFARMIGVSPGRVSQYISEGKITRDALDGEGVRAKVIVAVAKAQLQDRLDIGQRLGNGIATRLDAAPDLPPVLGQGRPSAPMLPTPGTSFEDRLKAEKLADMEMRNRKAREEERERQGQYTRTDDVRVALGQVASGMLNVFEGALSDFSLAVAAKFEVPQRDVLHLLRAEFRAVRQKAADAATRASRGAPAVVADEASDQVAEAA